MIEDYRFRPLDYLNNINSSSPNFIDTILKIGQKNARNLALYFLLIDLMQETKIPFYVKGGIISYYHLEYHARETFDIDIIIRENSDSFYKKLGEVLSSCKMDFSFFISKYEKIPANNRFYYDEFYMKIQIKYLDIIDETITIDGICSPFFDDIDGTIYKGPKIFREEFGFLGVPLEYVMAEKIIAVTNELKRPYKHLVDVYSMIQKNIDVLLLKKYLFIINNSDNEKRKQFNKEEKTNKYHISDDKEFDGSFILAELNAGYNESFEEMKDKINQWFNKYLN